MCEIVHSTFYIDSIDNVPSNPIGLSNIPFQLRVGLKFHLFSVQFNRFGLDKKKVRFCFH